MSPDVVTVVQVVDERPHAGSTTTAPGGGGDVTGPAGATADAVPLFDGATGGRKPRPQSRRWL